MKRLRLTALALCGLGAGVWTALASRRPPLPPDLRGVFVFVSDRSGIPSLYARRFPSDEERLLAALPESLAEPALSRDGGRVAFASRGRIAVVYAPTGDVRFLTLGVDWRDAEPAWRPDGRALVVTARSRDGGPRDLHLLELGTGEPARRPLTQTAGLDESAPTFSPDATAVVFVRDDQLSRLVLADGRTTRLTHGFRTFRNPRFLPSGRLVCLWTQGKQNGIDVMDADGKNRETLYQGSIYYRTLAPSPDGRYLAATFTYDLRAHPGEALKLRQTEELRLLDARGAEVARLHHSWRHAHHSPDWGR